MDSDDDALLCECLFRGLVFFLGREVPQEPLLFVIRAFGGTVAWDGEGSPLKEADESITHQVGCFQIITSYKRDERLRCKEGRRVEKRLCVFEGG